VWAGGVWSVVTEGGVVDLMDKNLAEGGGLVIWVQPEVEGDPGDGCGGGGQQANLSPSLERVGHKAHNFVRKLTKTRVAFIPSSHLFVNSLSHSPARLEWSSKNAAQGSS